ncbi:hypothetical protein B0H63DRAFT_388392, partial [Podospora didyma]
LYVRNLEERIKPEPLKEALHAIFSEYGNIIDIVAKKNLKAKGQAFIVFEDPESVANAIEEVQGFDLFDKPMHLAPARTRSDATVLRMGNEEEFDAHKRRRMAEKAEEQKRLKQHLPGATVDINSRPAKNVRGAGLKATGQGPAAVVPDEYLPPNRILFVQNLPDDFDKDALNGIFGHFEGFREVRTVPGRKGIAFVEYDTEAGAIAAKERTAGMTLQDGEKTMKVTYQRQ